MTEKTAWIVNVEAFGHTRQYRVEAESEEKAIAKAKRQNAIRISAKPDVSPEEALRIAQEEDARFRPGASDDL
jgi:hypothetical protein